MRCRSVASLSVAVDGDPFWMASRKSSRVFWISPRARESTHLRRRAASRTPLTMPTPWNAFPLSSANAPVPLFTQSGPLAWRTRFEVSGFFSLLQPWSAAAPRIARTIARVALLPTRYLRGGPFGRRPVRFLPQTVDAVQLPQHRLVLRQLVRLAHRLRGLLVVSRVLVGETEIPVRLRQLLAIGLGALLELRGGCAERLLRLVPLAALGEADPSIELGQIGIPLEIRGDELLIGYERLEEALDDGGAGGPRELLLVDG